MITLRQYSLRNCNFITKLTLPRTLIYLERASLTCLHNIKEIIIPASITKFEERIDAFHGLTKFIFERGSRLETIGSYFLQGSSELKEIAIPSTVKSIGSYFLNNCKKIEHVIFCGTADFTTLENPFQSWNSFESVIVSKEYAGSKFGGKNIVVKEFNNCFPVFRCPTKCNFYFIRNIISNLLYLLLITI